MDRLTSYCIVFLLFVACNSRNTQPKLKFDPVSSSVYSPNENYRNVFSAWENYYRHCTNQQLFSEAFYLQLQDKVYIGSINNQHAIDVNKGIMILDTSNNYGNIFNLLSIRNAFNCYDTIALVGNLKASFYNELVSALSGSAQYKGLASVIDTGQMKIRITTLYTVELIPDRLIELLSTTQDAKLIRFRELLSTAGNVLLAQTVEILGFSAEAPLKTRISPAERTEFAAEPFFNLGTTGDNVRLALLPNDQVRIQLNKRFTVLGKFLQLKSF